MISFNTNDLSPKTVLQTVCDSTLRFCKGYLINCPSQHWWKQKWLNFHLITKLCPGEVWQKYYAFDKNQVILIKFNNFPQICVLGYIIADNIWYCYRYLYLLEVVLFPQEKRWFILPILTGVVAPNFDKILCSSQKCRFCSLENCFLSKKSCHLIFERI